MDAISLVNLTPIETPSSDGPRALAPKPQSIEETGLSESFLAELLGNEHGDPAREVLIHNTFADKWAVRKGPWLYINSPSGQHSNMPDYFMELREYAPFGTDGLLFNLDQDPEQRRNRYAEYPDLIDELEGILADQLSRGYLQKDFSE